MCSRLPALAFGPRVPTYDDVLAASIVPKCAAFCQVVRRGGQAHLVYHRRALRRQVSGHNGFELVGQLHQFEMARVLRAIKRVTHDDLAQLGFAVDIAEHAVEQVQETLQVT